MSATSGVRVLVVCPCHASQQAPRTPRRNSRTPLPICPLCTPEHPGEQEVWVPYDSLLDQIRRDLNPNIDPRSQV